MSRLGVLRRKAARARSLTLRDWTVVAEAWWELARADVLVSAAPYRQWRDRLTAAESESSAAASSAESSAESSRTPVDARLVELFRVAARHHVRPMSCLRRAVALRALLERRGHDVTVRFGVRRAPGGIDAHAWVTVGGVVVDTGDSVRADYASLDAIGTGGTR